MPGLLLGAELILTAFASTIYAEGDPDRFLYQYHTIAITLTVHILWMFALSFVYAGTCIQIYPVPRLLQYSFLAALCFSLRHCLPGQNKKREGGVLCICFWCGGSFNCFAATSTYRTASLGDIMHSGTTNDTKAAGIFGMVVYFVGLIVTAFVMMDLDVKMSWYVSYNIDDSSTSIFDDFEDTDGVRRPFF